MERSTIERARRGDVEAFEVLVRSRMDAVYRLNLAIVGNEPDARDATQEAFLVAWRKLATLRDPDRFDAWLQRVCVNACRMTLRGQRRIREVHLAEEALPGRGESDAHRDLAWLDAAFRRLSVDERALLTLHHLEGRGLPELATLLEVPLGTVKSRLFAARRVLRAALEAERR
ncbi:sigma-70 family RNA polymerase sigma factor [soil metagenome]